MVRASCANTGFLSHILSKVKNYSSASNPDSQATCHNIHGLLVVNAHHVDRLDTVSVLSLSGCCLMPSQYFDLRLVFLFTYLCPEQKEIAKYNLQAVEIFRTTLETTLQTKLAGQSALTAGECNVIGTKQFSTFCAWF